MIHSLQATPVSKLPIVSARDTRWVELLVTMKRARSAIGLLAVVILILPHSCAEIFLGI